MKNLLKEFIPKLKEKRKELILFMKSNILSPYSQIECEENLNNLDLLINSSEYIYNNLKIK